MGTDGGGARRAPAADQSAHCSIDPAHRAWVARAHCGRIPPPRATPRRILAAPTGELHPPIPRSVALRHYLAEDAIPAEWFAAHSTNGQEKLNTARFDIEPAPARKASRASK